MGFLYFVINGVKSTKPITTAATITLAITANNFLPLHIVSAFVDMTKI